MSVETVAEGKYLRFIRRDGYELIERINCTGVVVIIAVTEALELVLVEQFRPALGRSVLELPAGLVSDVESVRGESLESAAFRELDEETGFTAQRLEHVGEWPTSSGMTSETVTVFKAIGISRTGSGGGDETENITVHVIGLREIDSWLRTMIARGIMVDAKVYAALYLIAAG